MSMTAKVIELVGTSREGWEDAVQTAVTEASKSIRHISGVEVTNMTAVADGDQITKWRATVKIAFGVVDDEQLERDKEVEEKRERTH